MAGKKQLTNEDIKVNETMYEIGKEDGAREANRALQSVVLSGQLGQLSGRAQAFGAMKLIAEFLEWKQIAEIVDNKEFLKIPGVTSINDYLESLGLGRSVAYEKMKIARKLEADEVRLLGQVGFTRKDLLGYASLPDEKRMEIREGKVINLEKADREEIREIIEQVLQENREVKEEATKAVEAREGVVRQKQKKIDEHEEYIAKLEKDNEALRHVPENEKEFFLFLMKRYMEVQNNIATFRKLIVESTAIPSHHAEIEVVNVLCSIMRIVTGLYQEAYDRFGAPSVSDGQDWIPPHLREALSQQ